MTLKRSLGVLLVLVPWLVWGLTKELVISYHTCIAGEGCHVMEQVSFHDSHVLLLTSANYQQKLQGRLINIESCPSKDTQHTQQSQRNHRAIALVQCGQCPLSDTIREASRLGVGGIVIANTNECGRPTKEFLESASNTRVPVAFVASKVASSIHAMQQMALEPHAEDERHDAFVYLSIRDSGESHVVNHILASTHILMATMVVVVLLVYLSLACSVGSLRYIPREIVPDLFGAQPEPVDKYVLEKLPLVPVAWEVPESHSASDEESRCESPPTDIGQARACLLQQLAGIIVRSGSSSYSFTDEKTCAICLDSYVRNESLRLLPCKHAFHRRCIDVWLLSDHMTAHCPVCKSSITDGLRLLDKHGYGDVLDLIYGRTHVRCLPTKTALPWYVYHVVRDGIRRLWNREGTVVN